MAAVVASEQGRWYGADLVQAGGRIYADNCASCHGAGGEGQPDWQVRDALGFYPAPPLNADGHAWHHPLAAMLETLAIVGGPNGGTMPSFADVLDENGQRAVLAYVQSLWPDDIYARWAAIDRGEPAGPGEGGHH